MRENERAERGMKTYVYFSHSNFFFSIIVGL